MAFFYLMQWGSDLSAQVTVGMNEQPLGGALLHLKTIEDDTSNGTENATQGLIFPRVKLTDVNKLYPMYLTDTDYNSDATKKAKLDLSHKGLTVYNVGSILSEGIYFWNGAKWLAAQGGGSVTIPSEPWLVSGSTNEATSNTHNIYQMGHVSIGNSGAIDATALLNVDATDKGVLLPRIELTAADDKVTIPNPTVGLLVYSTGTHANFSTKGYLFWNGTEWKLINNSTSIPAKISYLNCDGATLSPAAYYKNIAYEGVMKIPYSGGNGGYYSGGTTFTSHGLTFRLQDGKLENGVGELSFHVQGTPDISSPAPITIPINGSAVDKIEIPFWTGECNVVVGAYVTAETKTLSVMSPLVYTTEGRTGYAAQITTPDGKFSVRCFVIYGETFNLADLQIRNNTGSTVDLMCDATWLWGNLAGGAGYNQLRIPSGGWYGAATQDGAVSALNNGVLQTTSNANIAWGNCNVYEGNVPEQRQYVWTTHNQDDKVFYFMRFMMGTENPGAAANATNCPDGTCNRSKVYFQIDQITAP